MHFLEQILDSLDPFSSLLKYAGFGGAILGFIFYTFKEIIRKSIFPSLTKKQGYIIIMSLIITSFLFAITALLTTYHKTENTIISRDSLKYEPVILEKEGVVLEDTTNKKSKLNK